MSSIIGIIKIKEGKRDNKIMLLLSGVKAKGMREIYIRGD